MFIELYADCKGLPIDTVLSKGGGAQGHRRLLGLARLGSVHRPCTTARQNYLTGGCVTVDSRRF